MRAPKSQSELFKRVKSESETELTERFFVQFGQKREQRTVYGNDVVVVEASEKKWEGHALQKG